MTELDKAGTLKPATMPDGPELAAPLHAPERTSGIVRLFDPSGDDAADMAAIREYYRPWQGKNRGTV